MRTPPLLGIVLQENQVSFSTQGIHSTSRENQTKEFQSSINIFTFKLMTRIDGYLLQKKCSSESWNWKCKCRKTPMVNSRNNVTKVRPQIKSRTNVSALVVSYCKSAVQVIHWSWTWFLGEKAFWKPLLAVQCLQSSHDILFSQLESRVCQASGL